VQAAAALPTPDESAQRRLVGSNHAERERLPGDGAQFGVVGCRHIGRKRALLRPTALMTPGSQASVPGPAVDGF